MFTNYFDFGKRKQIKKKFSLKEVYQNLKPSWEECLSKKLLRTSQFQRVLDREKSYGNSDKL